MRRGMRRAWRTPGARVAAALALIGVLTVALVGVIARRPWGRRGRAQ